MDFPYIASNRIPAISQGNLVHNLVREKIIESSDVVEVMNKVDRVHFLGKQTRDQSTSDACVSRVKIQKILHISILWNFPDLF